MIQIRTATTRLTCANSSPAISEKASGATKPRPTPAKIPKPTQTVKKRSNKPKIRPQKKNLPKRERHIRNSHYTHPRLHLKDLYTQ